MHNLTIRAEKISKKFKIFHEPPLTLQKAAYNFLRGKRNYQELWALKDISFSVNKSESVGLIGPNGSGKSTLLRILANIYLPTCGLIEICGRVAPSLELGSGFLAEFTGMENLYLYAAVFGLPRAQIARKVPEIIEFSQLRDFFDVPLRQYSFGMRMRLAFSIAVNIDPDIVLIDETLAVGDLSFREKCYRKIEELKGMGKTLILVSQHMEEIQRLCDRTILLDKGKIEFIGATSQAIREYEKLC